MDPLIITIAVIVIVATAIVKVNRKQEEARYRKRYQARRTTQFDLLMAAEGKLDQLQSQLEDTGTFAATDCHLAKVHSYPAVGGQNHEIKAELKELRLAYEQGDISLIVYNQQLDKLFNKIDETKYSLQAAG